ncbi:MULTISPECIES: class I SAM-dependent methyltransferase [unclassified Streptomyces]|uniref:class I SAM-dependent methyltransferase n=1 Tax=unclassified Streptomyces TaxID=2593676 RepID=UPI0001C19041|nr:MULTISPECIES: class I SAM-dependent methyltransferase [unclassified Streptomyces]AEN13746.1 Methyltransferase type 11 [Streptomyces sp. SirexAA-E]MYR64577.1 methyltransferase domain-containing protein [Streptomyces sp. SID4939]MYR99223.1 methyltransferase domain-containing protein [Streptomyces sp. SID4940]MYT67634.1 methyltransferase domain-containing protein [Streptomyces sp. SID8357]MYT86478.1 methyltransferase domain-containing protein [Streptomyces sp. SID8360]
MSTTLPPPGPGHAPWTTDPYANALRNGRGPLFLRRPDGWLLPLDVERWCADADAADLSALHRCEGPVIDIGCGPGRLVAALAARGHRALGIDVSDAAVDHTQRLGGSALRRSVFDPLPAEGRWGTALLIDGNIGIGGDPGALLRRVAVLLAPRGLLVAEATPQDVDERVQVRLDDGRGAAATAPHFRWARVGAPALLRYARSCDWQPVDEWEADGRPFLALRHARTLRGPNLAGRRPRDLSPWCDAPASHHR